MKVNNVGNWDRALRIALGIVLLALVAYGPHTAWGWLGFIPLISGVVGFCPVYKLLGVSTCAAKPRAA